MNIYPHDHVSEALNLRNIYEVCPDFDTKDTSNISEEFTPWHRGSGELNPFYGMKHSKETKELISSILRNGQMAGENNPNYGGKSVGFRGKKHTEKAKKAISKGNTGKVRSKEAVEKVRLANLGRKDSEEAKAKKSKAQSKRTKHPFQGKTQSDYQKEAVRKANSGVPKKKVCCPHCQKEVAVNMANRWHFDNCKHKIYL